MEISDKNDVSISEIIFKLKKKRMKYTYISTDKGVRR